MDQMNPKKFRKQQGVSAWIIVQHAEHSQPVLTVSGESIRLESKGMLS